MRCPWFWPSLVSVLYRNAYYQALITLRVASSLEPQPMEVSI